MKANWKKVNKKEFDIIINNRDINTHTVMICEPAITFFWDSSLPKGAMWDIYDTAIGKIIRDFNLTTMKQTPKYYINLSVVGELK